MVNNRKFFRSPGFDRPDLFFVVAVTAGIALRIFLILTRQYSVSFDEAHYLRLAGTFINEGVKGLFHPYWPPLYPAVTGVVSFLVKNLELSGRLVNVFASAGISAVIYSLGKRVFSKKIAVTGAFLFLIYPPVAYESTFVVTEPLYTLLGLSGILSFFIGIERRKTLNFLIAGLLWGAGYLVRPEGAGFLIVALGFLILSFLPQLFKNKNLLIWVIAVVFGFILISSPYLIYLKKTTGKWTLSTKGMVNQQLEAAVEFNSGSVKDPFFHLTSDNKHLPVDMAYHFGNIQDLSKIKDGKSRIVKIGIKEYAEKYLRNLNKVLKEAVPRVVTVILLIFATAGFLSKYYSKKEWSLVFYLTLNVVFFWFIVVPFFHVNYRYLLPLFPLFFIWISAGIYYLHNWLEISIDRAVETESFVKTKRRFISGFVVTGVFVLICIVLEAGRIFVIKKYKPGLWDQPVEIKEAGLWLKSNTDHPPVLLSINKAADFYAGQYNMKLGASFSYDPVDRIIKYAKYRKCGYVVFSSRYLSWFKNCSLLLNPEKMPKELKLVYDRTGPAGVRAVIYKILYN